MFKGLSKLLIRNLPTVMTIAGSAGVIAGSVMVCKATLHVDEVMANNRALVESVKESGYSDEKEYRKNLAFSYGKGAVEWAKLYGPSALVIGFSIGSILYGHNILRARNLALVGAYKALTIEHQNYRNRVRELVGVDDERAAHYEIEQVKINDPETGKEKTVHYIMDDPDIPYNEHAKFFCESSIYWTKNPEENLMFLLDVMRKMQDKFDKQGYLFLNDVYRELDIPETYGGAVCGWIKGLGDTNIDFGIFDCYKEGSKRFVNGLEPVILLDFNHDGYIADKI